jgi:hypothetical protein
MAPIASKLAPTGCLYASVTIKDLRSTPWPSPFPERGHSPTLKQRLKHAERVNRWKAQALIAPLVLFLLLVFLVPIVALLYKSVGNPEVVGGMPRTVTAIASWDGRGLPAEPVYKAASEDLAEARKNQTWATCPSA